MEKRYLRTALVPAALAIAVAGACNSSSSTTGDPAAMRAGSGASASRGGGGAESGGASETSTGDGGSDSDGAAGGGLGACAPMAPCPKTGCVDFPAVPLFDPATPTGAGTRFGTAVGNAGGGGASSGVSGGPCLVEPGEGALLPHNWVRPRFRWIPANSSQTLFEIRVHVDGQKNDLVAYTTNTVWKMPADVWRALAMHSTNRDIVVTVRGTTTSGAGTVSGSQMKFQIAPANANGSMVYWAAVGDKNGDSWLEGFQAGDETVAQVLNVSQVQETYSRDNVGSLATNGSPTAAIASAAGSVQCIGCHAAVPDHTSVTFLDFLPWPGVAADLTPANAGNVPSWLTPGGAEALALPWVGMMAFSPAIWDAGHHIVVAGWQVGPNDVPWQGGRTDAPSSLVWIDLSTSQPLTFVDDAGARLPNLIEVNPQQFVVNNRGKSYDFIARTNDPRGASCPTFSHDGRTIAYVSNDNAAKDGRLAQGAADIFTVPFNDKLGGVATPVMGAADPGFDEYYPWFSPDDRYIAFNRVPAGQVMYYNAQSEVYVVPADGGTATRLIANDPPACGGMTSPGVTNSWPKWAPQTPTCGGKTYYWVVFSSSRMGLPFNAQNFKAGTPEATSQLYLTAVVADAAGNLTTYPAVYIWNQPTTSLAFPGSNQSNHTPLWDVVSIPAAVPPK